VDAAADAMKIAPYLPYLARTSSAGKAALSTVDTAAMGNIT
jgi:hypothetical protein